MLVRRFSQLVTTITLAVAFVAFAAVAGWSDAQAQGRYFNHRGRGHYVKSRHVQNRHRRREIQALRRHQRAERFRYGNSPALRRHQRQEWRELMRRRRLERSGFFGRSGRSRYYRRGF
jgi:N12 class adenine-specific DNA methylase